MLDHGAHVVVCDDLYGGSYRLFENVRRRTANLDFSYVDASDLAVLESAIRPATRMFWMESPSNPLLKLADLEAIAALAKRRGLLTVVDNTFASPYCQRPLTLGFDVVVHSTTKYINGHSDIIGGATVVGENAELEEKLRFLQNAVGAISGPFDCFLALRGLKTLSLRMERHCQNALQLAQWLEGRPEIERVIYPGLESHPQHALARRQMNGFGGMIGAVLAGGLERTVRFLGRLPALHVGRKPGRGGKPDRTSRPDDPRLLAAGEARGRGHRRRPGADLRGRGGHRRPDRRLPPGPGVGFGAFLARHPS